MCVVLDKWTTPWIRQITHLTLFINEEQLIFFAWLSSFLLSILARQAQVVLLHSSLEIPWILLKGIHHSFFSPFFLFAQSALPLKATQIKKFKLLLLLLSLYINLRWHSPWSKNCDLDLNWRCHRRPKFCQVSFIE